MKSVIAKLSLLLVSTGTFATEYSIFPDWLVKDECTLTEPFPFPSDLTQLKPYPLDAYNKLVKSCEKLKPVKPSESKKLDYLDHRYALFSWLSFIALNRQLDENYKLTQNNLKVCTADSGANCPLPLWINWRETETIFTVDATPPVNWDISKNFAMMQPLSAVEQVAPKNEPKKHAILTDQKNNPVYYQKFVSPYVFNFITKNKLYSIDGQIEFANNPTYSWACKSQQASNMCINMNTIGFLACSDKSSLPTCNLPQNLTSFDPKPPGLAIEIKVAWKLLDESDDPSKYIRAKLPVKRYNQIQNGEADSFKIEEKEVGVVGFHIMQKTGTSSNWIYATFSHQNNVWGNSPTFFNKQCPTCAINHPVGGTKPTQVVRLEQISPVVEQVNQHISKLFKQENAVLQYYKLIGTQYSTNNRSKPMTDINGQASDTIETKLINYSGGMPHPVYLTNEVIETFLQLGNQPQGKEEALYYKSSSCMNCHAAGGIATECDKSTGKPIFTPRTADFSFIYHDAKTQFKNQNCIKEEKSN
ncbi:hypothetical protein [Pseudoalteromonas sp. Of11M-6]|uniref:hypothetical protein n=1 Tax=Pseudoalteromonas sp. Of11M-6 TaxID=2917754 RepID=UPI001EF55EFC|nr:hypothetical protein [Pseudoalteromonas sp. Of11M-6]MCG7554624.1 hypothetical protein [Pseudoalteromonas sp. Of11M-6]